MALADFFSFFIRTFVPKRKNNGKSNVQNSALKEHKRRKYASKIRPF